MEMFKVLFAFLQSSSFMAPMRRGLYCTEKLSPGNTLFIRIGSSSYVYLYLGEPFYNYQSLIFTTYAAF